MKRYELYKNIQLKICKKTNAFPVIPNEDTILGIADNVFEGLQPINGMRHPAEAQTNGWYIWAGEELSQEPDFFKPLHTRHLIEKLPEILKYLGLPNGYRFLIDDKGHEDIWYDEKLLKI